MAVATVAGLSFRPENGWDDPNLPIAVWEASESVTGNATGGGMIVQINLKAANVQPGNVFSLEQLMLDDSAVANSPVSMATPGMATFLPGDIARSWAVPLTEVDSSTQLRLPVHTQPRLFLGRGAGFAAAGTLTFTLLNADTETLLVAAMGYMWSPRSVMQGQGGYRRPPDGMFGV